MFERKALSSSLPSASDHDVFDAFDKSAAADDYKPLPKGNYEAVAIEGGLTESKTGTRGYKVAFKVMGGEYANRRLWRTWFLTDAAMSYTKRDLAKFGITSAGRLRQPLPPDRFVVKLSVSLRTLDDGTQVNEVKAVDLVRVQEPQADPFSPSAEALDALAAFNEIDAPVAPAAAEGRS